jgi:hypothetical protein
MADEFRVQGMYGQASEFHVGSLNNSGHDEKVLGSLRRIGEGFVSTQGLAHRVSRKT